MWLRRRSCGVNSALVRNRAFRRRSWRRPVGLAQFPRGPSPRNRSLRREIRPLRLGLLLPPAGSRALPGRYATGRSRPRKAVRKNIMAIIDGEGMSKLPKAQQHFRNCISFGTFIRYTPEGDIDWMVQKKSDATA